MLGLYRDNGTENGSYNSGFRVILGCRRSIGITENKMDTTV